jgi:hypothetical protein
LYKSSEICVKCDYNEGQISEPVSINKGVRQGYGLLPDLFNIYVNKAIKEWKQKSRNGIQLTSGESIQTLLCVGAQVKIVKSDELQMTINELNTLRNMT